jgi:sarcosine oxidase subunit beta
MTAKAFVCRCEDITLDDCTQAIRAGYACFEDLKRFLGVGTGPCQGKACVAAAMQVIAAERRVDPATVDLMTFRPPVRPVPLATLAAPDADEMAAGRVHAQEADAGRTHAEEADADAGEAGEADAGRTRAMRTGTREGGLHTADPGGSEE